MLPFPALNTPCRLFVCITPLQITDTVFPMYKAFIEPDLKAAQLKIHNSFNPFTGVYKYGAGWLVLTRHAVLRGCISPAGSHNTRVYCARLQTPCSCNLPFSNTRTCTHAHARPTPCVQNRLHGCHLHPQGTTGKGNDTAGSGGSAGGELKSGGGGLHVCVGSCVRG